MKRNRYLVLLFLLLLGITIGLVIYRNLNRSITIQHAGRLAITKGGTVLSGNFSPNSELGKDGDYYIDENIDCMYGPKKYGRWPTQCEVIGRLSVHMMK